MKKKSIYFLGLLMVFVLFGFQNSLISQTQDQDPCPPGDYVRIENILNNPGPFIKEKVEVKGIVKNFVEEPNKTTAYYLLEGKYGAVIKVLTYATNEPKKVTYYKVKGTVLLDGDQVYIHEDVRIECVDKKDDDNDGVLNSVDKCPNTPAGVEVDSNGCKKSTTSNLMLIIIGAGVLIVIIIVVVVMIEQNKKKEAEERRRQQEIEQKRKEEERKANENKRTSDTKGNLNDDDDFKTIKLFIDDPKTMKFIPGRLEIISGDDKGKTFLISGYPTPEGSVVTLGRESVSGERRYAHIQLDKRFKTVSRKQAELIYRSGKLYAKNLSETNFTQVDGRELKVDQIAEVLPGSVIRTGELEFKYIV